HIPATDTKRQAARITASNNAASRHASLLTGCAGIPYVAGTAIRFLDICRTDAIEVFERKRLKASRSVFGTILNARVNALDEMDEQVKSGRQLVAGSITE